MLEPCTMPTGLLVSALTQPVALLECDKKHRYRAAMLPLTSNTQTAVIYTRFTHARCTGRGVTLSSGSSSGKVTRMLESTCCGNAR